MLVPIGALIKKKNSLFLLTICLVIKKCRVSVSQLQRNLSSQASTSREITAIAFSFLHFLIRNFK